MTRCQQFDVSYNAHVACEFVQKVDHDESFSSPHEGEERRKFPCLDVKSHLAMLFVTFLVGS